jgi:alcohol dehydrogenase class IV
MSTFDFFSVGRVVFGPGTGERLGELAAELGHTALVVTNADEFGKGGVADRITRLLAGAGISVHGHQQRGEPTVAHVQEAVETARTAACDMVVGVGGGSAIDAAKAVAGLLTNGGLPLDYMEVVGQGLPLTKPAAPWIAVPTTAGTGAEVTRNAVIGCPEKRYKASLRSEKLLASIALVDPELGLSVPSQTTASSGMDALCQLIESYTSNRAQPITDALALKGIHLAACALPRVYEDGGKVDARGDMAMAALLSGLTLTNVGLGAVHGFAAPLGANFPIPHGTVCAALLPHVVAANLDALQAESPDHPCLDRYAEIGRVLTGETNLQRQAAWEAAVRFLQDLASRLRIPSLRQFGVEPARFAELVALARRASSMRYNPVTLSDEALSEILARACD